MTRAIRISDANLPESLEAALTKAGVTSGFVSAVAIVEDVELRVFDPIAGRSGARRRIQGRLEAVSLTGAISATGNGALCTLRAVLSRETDVGIETFAGQIASARIVSFDGWIHEPLSEAIDVASPPREAPRAPAPSPPPPPPSPEKTAWAQASREAERAVADRDSEPHVAPRPKDSGPSLRSEGATLEAQIPPRPPARPTTGGDEIYPEGGDLVDHFAFGRCEVMKSDGDRLILKLGKDGRLKEIALEMLKVSPRPDEDGKRVYKLDRKM